jgi:hypothetical protein
LEAIHNKGLRIALEAFCICATKNIMCESGFKDLIERRKRKIIEMVLHVAEDAEHPMNQHLENRRAYDQYAERPKLIRPFFSGGASLEATFREKLKKKKKKKKFKKTNFQK